MLYVDTSALVKLYVVEDGSAEVVSTIRQQGVAIPRTVLHELEFVNAIQLKAFRRELSGDQTRELRARFDEHLDQGVYFVPSCDWSQVWGRALDLARRHSMHLGTRSLDILHVAVALEIGARGFLTADQRQSTLAAACGLALVG